MSLKIEKKNEGTKDTVFLTGRLDTASNVGQLLFTALEGYGQHQIDGFLIGGLVLLIGHLLFQALVIG